MQALTVFRRPFRFNCATLSLCCHLLVVSFQLKVNIVDKWQERERLVEELSLLQQEMTNFLHFYRHKICSNIQLEIEALEKKLSTREGAWVYHFNLYTVSAL